MRVITKNIFESLTESTSGNTIKEYAMNYLDGYIDNDVTDTEIDMMVAFCFDFNEEPDANYKDYCDFMNLIAERTKVVRVTDSSYGATLTCDFSSLFKPYNEQLKEFFNMDNSEFDEDEAYYEAVLNLEPLISGNAGDSSYRELINILNSKPMNESVDENSGPYTVTGIAHVIDWYGDEGTIEMEPYEILEITPENICQGANDNGFGVKEIIGIDAYIDGEEYNYSGDEFKKYSQGKEQIGIQIPKVDLGEINNIEYYVLYTLNETYPVIKVNDKFLLTRQGTNDFSGQWRLEGFIEANKYNYKWMISPTEALNISDWKYKNGNLKYTIVDYDHGSSRRWGGGGTGNRPYGFSSIDIDGFKKVIGNEDNIKIEDKTYTLKSSVNESEELNNHKMNSIKYKTDGYTEATDGYYKGKPIVDYKEKDFKKGTSVLMPFICSNCYKEFYVKSNIHDFFEQGDFDDPYETPKDDLRCPKCKERDIDYNGEVLIKEPGVKENINESYINKKDLTDEEIIQAAKHILRQYNSIAQVWGGMNAVENELWNYFKEKKGWTEFPSNLYERFRNALFRNNPKMDRYVEKIKANDIAIYNVDRRDLPKEVAKGKTPEERKNILYRCYVDHPNKKEMNRWTLKDLVDYIKEKEPEVKYYYPEDRIKDRKSIVKSCLLCGLPKEEAEELDKELRALDLKESEDLAIYTDFSNFPNEVAKGKTPEERKNIFYRCYVANPKEDEMHKWTIKDLVEYIKETDEYYNKDYKYIFKCCLLCGLTKEEAKELCGEKLNEDIEDKNIGIRKKQLEDNIYDIVCLYDNGINDGVEGYEPFKSEKDLVDYVYSQVFDQKSDGDGSTIYGNGICRDLKYLGKDYIVSEIIRIGNEIGVVNTKLTESVDEGSLSKFIKDSVEKLQNSNYTNCKYNLDDKYAVFVGWSDGYEAEETNEYEIHSKENPTYCINAAIGIRNDADWADFDSIKRPYYEAGDVFEGEWTVSPHEDYSYLANSILKTYYYMLDLIESGELLTEDASIDNDPDLNREQVNADVDYWSDVDEANTEDVSGREPVGVYTVSNTQAIYVYDIKHDIDDMVLAGDSSDTTKAKWRYINYEDLTDEETGESIPFFYYGDIKVPLNEVVRTNI